MNEEKINQILKNQATILLALSDDGKYNLETLVSMKNRIREVADLLNPLPETICPLKEKTEEHFGEDKFGTRKE